MPKFGAQIDTQLIPIKGMRPEQSTVFPASPVEGQMIHRTDQNKVYQYLAGAWQQIAPAGAPLTHTHLWADITDKPTTFTPSAHSHSATEINYAGGSTLPASTVEAALDSLDTLTNDTMAFYNAHVTSGTHAADKITYAGSAGISATNVEGALDELDTEKAPKANPTFTGTVSGVTKAHVGLSNVDNTSDANKPISTATMLALNARVSLDGDENIAGVKAFLSSPIVPATPTDSVHAASKAYVDSIVASQDAMVFKGVIDASANPNYPAASRGDTYRISVAGRIGGASGPRVEVGDLIICLTDSTAAGTHATVGTNWTIVQTNLDGAVVSAASSSGVGNIAIFDDASGKVIGDSTIAISTTPVSGGSANLVPTQSAVKSALDLKSDLLHTHTLDDLMGTLGIAKGGTGATDAATARTNLGITSDAAAGTASMRTLGTGATQAAAGNHTHAFTAITGTAALTQGGTGATTAAAARTNLVAAGAYSVTFATALTAGAWSANITHSLNSQFVDVTINEVASGEQHILDWKTTGVNTIQIRSDIAYAANALRVLVTSK